jgi:DAK2 domain fusion protein YloV
MKISIPRMQTLEGLGATDLVAVVTNYRDLLRANRERINALNVYPVPDGDTGTNMALTLDSVVQEIAGRTEGAESPDLTEVAKAISHGSLMGARGNSGVILSQILRGLAAAFSQAAADDRPIDGTVVVDGLARARDGAYQAVGNPVEGTILTVVRAAAEAAAAAAEAAGGNPGLVSVLEAAQAGAERALEGTPDLLPALKAAGVVDSGGAGLVLLFPAALHVVDGRALPEPVEDASTTARPATGGGAGRPDPAGGNGLDPLGELRYEVMYLLEAPDDAIGEFRKVWAGVGDSIVVVGGDGIYNCHIHTDDIGAAIEAALDAGRPRQIRVSDLWDQVEEERWVREAGAGEPFEASVEPVGCAVVAVCNGDGVRRIFHSLGVTTTVSGGQSMNPSTADLLAAIDAAPSEQVVILPNNKNITPVAEAAAAGSAKTVVVVPTVGIPEGFAALLEYDPEGDAAANAEGMAASAARVVAGEVTRSVRDTEGPTGPIAVGDWLGLTRAGIQVVTTGLADACIALLAQMIDDAHHEIATIIVGEGAPASETRRVTEWLGETWPRISVEVHQGGQPLYPYLFSIE